MPTKRPQRLALPTKGVVPLEHFWQHPICIYGMKGIGKSTLASISIQQLLPPGKKTLNFRFERGRRNLAGILQVPEPTATSAKRLTWPLFKEYLELFCEDESMHTAVIDSVDKAYDECFEYICSDHNVEHPGEAGREGYAIWDSIKIEFEAAFRVIQDYDKTFVILSHEKTRTTELPDGTDFERMDLSCKPAAGKIAKDLCEFLFYYGYTGTGMERNKSSDRVITIRNRDNAVECSCGRDDVFLQPDDELLYRFKVPNKPKLVAQVIQDAYDNKVYDYDRDLEAEERKAKRAAKRTAKTPARKKKRTSR